MLVSTVIDIDTGGTPRDIPRRREGSAFVQHEGGRGT